MVHLTPQIKWLSVLTFFSLFLFVRGLNIYYLQADPIRPNPIVADIRDYAAVMVSAEHPEAFQADLLYGNGIRREIYSTYSWIYMQGFRFFAGDDLERGLLWYNLFAQALYLLGMFGLLMAVLEAEAAWAALMAIVSLFGSGFIGSGTQWGIGFDLVVPTTLFTALAPYLLWWVYVRWIKHPQPKAAETALMGLALGILLTRLNLVNGLALAQVLLGIALIWVLGGRLAWQTLASFAAALGLSFLLLYQVFAPAEALSGAAYSWEGAQAVIQVGEANMVFPWGLGRVNWLKSPFGKELLAGVIFAYTLGTIFCLLAYRRKAEKNTAYAFVWLQGAGMLLILNAGFLPLLATLYGLIRVRLGQISRTENWLALFLAIALPLGPVQQILAYYLWQAGQLVPLTGLLFELMRFSQFAYVPLYLILALFGLSLTQNFSSSSLKGLVWLALAGLIWLNQNQVPFALFSRGEVGVLLLLFFLWLPFPIRFPPFEFVFYGFKITFISLIILLLAVSAPPPSPAPSRYTLTPDYLAAAAWAKENTPPDSLFLLTNLDGSWRYYAQRPILTAREEWIYAMYIGLDPLHLKDIETQIRLQEPQILVDLAQQSQSNFLVLADEIPLQSNSAPLFANATYTIYATAQLKPDQSPLQDYPELYADYQKHKLSLPIPPEAIIFNPATGSVAGSQIRQAAEFAPDLDLLHLLHRQKLEAMLQLDPAQRAALADWRKSKNRPDLQRAGIDFLLVSSDWLFLLDEKDYQSINSYPLLKSWQVGGQTFFLYALNN